jgi:hypothetical protein
MSRKYIKQIINQDFVYPNADVSEYDIEIVHDINNNSVSGTVSNFTATTVNATGITFSFDYTWAKNNAEPFINDNTGYIEIASVHMMAPSQNYFKPWRCVADISSSNINATTFGATTTFSVLPSQLGLSTFTAGIYYFEVRMIGHRAVYPICVEYTVSSGVPTPTPTVTPTMTPTPPGPTPTPTPTPALTGYTSGATINVTDPGWIKYTTISGTTYQYVGSYGTNILSSCLICSTIDYGYPFADLAAFTVTNCGSTCTP